MTIVVTGRELNYSINCIEIVTYFRGKTGLLHHTQNSIPGR